VRELVGGDGLVELINLPLNPSPEAKNMDDDVFVGVEASNSSWRTRSAVFRARFLDKSHRRFNLLFSRSLE
jgi:hypothetical protein